VPAVFVALASPVADVASLVPSLLPVLPLVTLPPRLPVWLFDEPEPSPVMSPLLALASVSWSLPLKPCTLDDVSLPPLFAWACCDVWTLLCWRTTAAEMPLAPLGDAKAATVSTEALAVATVHMNFFPTLTDAASL
jgi:hypothetical protein